MISLLFDGESSRVCLRSLLRSSHRRQCHILATSASFIEAAYRFDFQSSFPSDLWAAWKDLRPSRHSLNAMYPSSTKATEETALFSSHKFPYISCCILGCLSWDRTSLPHQLLIFIWQYFPLYCFTQFSFEESFRQTCHRFRRCLIFGMFVTNLRLGLAGSRPETKVCSNWFLYFYSKSQHSSQLTLWILRLVFARFLDWKMIHSISASIQPN